MVENENKSNIEADTIHNEIYECNDEHDYFIIVDVSDYIEY